MNLNIVSAVNVYHMRSRSSRMFWEIFWTVMVLAIAVVFWWAVSESLGWSNVLLTLWLGSLILAGVPMAYLALRSGMDRWRG